LFECLRSIHRFYNERYGYPVFVYYFDDIYDSRKYRDKVHREIGPHIHFISVPYKTPKHIREEDLFYNRRNLWYARRKFPRSRKGYLHMCNFKFNMYGYPNTRLHEYDYVMTFDDEAGHVRKLPYDPVKVMAGREEDMGALIVGRRLKNGSPHQGHLDTRVGLWKFVRRFIVNQGVQPKSPLLRVLLTHPNGEWNFHFLPWAGTYVVKTRMFRSDLWAKWIQAVNESGGIYKFRWGDNELLSLFYLMYDDKPIHNFKAVEKGYHDQGLFRKKQNIAPGVKDLDR